MNPQPGDQTYWLSGVVLTAMVVLSVAGLILSQTVRTDRQRAAVRSLNTRNFTWWMLMVVFGLASVTGNIGAVIIFTFISFLALRELVTLTPTRQGDQRTLFWVFFVILPLQYVLVAIKWYGLFSIMIPVYAVLFVPARSALAGDTGRFLERMAKIQWGLMLGVYGVSCAPALLSLDLVQAHGQNANLIFYFVLVVEMDDMLQPVWDRTLGRHKLAPNLRPDKTWEGFVGGILSATLIGTGWWWATPFTLLQAAVMSLAIALAGSAGKLIMTAIKRDGEIKDRGPVQAGQGGLMDRIGSLCFAAPVFFHLTRYYFT
jgi:phosphatidate cytidylyltransferase